MATMSLRVFHRCGLCCRRPLTAGLVAGSMLVAGQVAPVAGQAAGHPLDALTAKEYWVAYDALRAAGRTDTATRFAGIALREPPKAEVLAWKPGAPFRQEAVVVVRQAMGRRGLSDIAMLRCFGAVLRCGTDSYQDSSVGAFVW